MIHKEKHPLAGQVVKLDLAGKGLNLDPCGDFKIEDWWDRVSGGSWMTANGNPACLAYAMRSGFADRHIPIDNEVVYGHQNGLGHLIHVSELAVTDQQQTAVG